MNIIPQTFVQLMSGVNIDKNHENVIYYSNEGQYEDYYQSHIVITFEDFTYNRQNQTIRLPVDADSILQCNYLRYKNSNYTNRWIYAFIDDIEYANDGVCFVFFTIDWYASFRDKMTVEASFVERCHTPDDTPGEYTYPEQIEAGPIVTNEYNFSNKLKDMCILVGVAYETESAPITVSGSVGSTAVSYVIPSVKKNYGGGTMLSGVYSGSKYYVWKASEYLALNAYLNELMKNGEVDMITSISMIPSAFIEGSSSGGAEVDGSANNTIDKFFYFDNKYGFFGHVDGYIPRNKKLLTREFNFLSVYNMNGTETEIYLEYFNSNEINFEVQTCVSPEPSCRLIPKNYKSRYSNTLYDEGIMLKGWPLCSFSYNAYTNYLGANRANIQGEFVNTTAGSIWDLVGNLLTLDIQGIGNTLISTSQKITSTLVKRRDGERVPNTVRGQGNTGDLNISNGTLDYMIMHKSISTAYARKIDNYFDMYGYRINDLAEVEPLLNCRPSWNYIKTADAKITGEAPIVAKEEYAEMLNNGCTFWHNDDPQNYLSGDNTIK